jgi:hypothetical protein
MLEVFQGICLAVACTCAFAVWTRWSIASETLSRVDSLEKSRVSLEVDVGAVLDQCKDLLAAAETKRRRAAASESRTRQDAPESTNGEIPFPGLSGDRTLAKQQILEWRRQVGFPS